MAGDFFCTRVRLPAPSCRQDAGDIWAGMLRAGCRLCSVGQVRAASAIYFGCVSQARTVVLPASRKYEMGIDVVSHGRGSPIPLTDYLAAELWGRKHNLHKRCCHPQPVGGMRVIYGRGCRGQEAGCAALACERGAGRGVVMRSVGQVRAASAIYFGCVSQARTVVLPASRKYEMGIDVVSHGRGSPIPLTDYLAAELWGRKHNLHKRCCHPQPVGGMQVIYGRGCRGQEAGCAAWVRVGLCSVSL